MGGRTIRYREKEIVSLPARSFVKAFRLGLGIPTMTSGGKMRRARIACVLVLCLGLVFSSVSVLAQKSGPAAAEKINLNSATVEQLQSLPGIGPSTAKGIVEYRAKAGKFNRIEEIMNVKGIGEKKFQKIKDRLTL
jgi:comEA protein